MSNKLKNYYSKFELDNKDKKAWFGVTSVLLIIYVYFVIWGQNYFYNNSFNAFAIVLFVLAIPAIAGLLYLLTIMRDDVDYNAKRTKNKGLLIAFGSALLLLAVFVFIQFFVWNGQITADSTKQLEQAITGDYYNWHPVIHTWLFFTIPYKIFGTVSSILLVQNICFAAAVGYLFYVLYDEKAKISFMLVSYAFIFFNYATYKISTHPWKDTALVIVAIVFFTHIVRIFMSKGEWLNKPVNFIVFCTFAFLTSVMRHNAILLTIPAFIIMLFINKNIRKKILASLATTLAFIILLNYVVYPLANVENAKYRQFEIVGVPMTVLTDLYIQDPSALTPDAKEFMDVVMDGTDTHEYVFGNWDSVKFYISQDHASFVEQTGATTVLKYAFSSAFSDADSFKMAVKSALGVTKCVWSFNLDYHIFLKNATLDFNSGLKQAIVSLGKVAFYGVGGIFYSSFGFVIMLMMFTAIARIGKNGIIKSLLILSPLIYNFGTMAVLAGSHSLRFFHFNFLIVVPILFLIFNNERVNDKIEA